MGQPLRGDARRSPSGAVIAVITTIGALMSQTLRKCQLTINSTGQQKLDTPYPPVYHQTMRFGPVASLFLTAVRA